MGVCFASVPGPQVSARRNFGDHDHDPIPRIQVVPPLAHVPPIPLNTPTPFYQSVLHAFPLPAMPEPLTGATSTAVINAACIVVLLGVSLATYGYNRALEPLYGTAAVEHHLNKIVWSICIAGTSLPALPVWPSILFTGCLLCAMPQTVYWVAVWTGRMGDPIWGPVITHFAIIAPVMYLGCSAVKKLQVRVACSARTSVSDSQNFRQIWTQAVFSVPLSKRSRSPYAVWPSCRCRTCGP